MPHTFSTDRPTHLHPNKPSALTHLHMLGVQTQCMAAISLSLCPLLQLQLCHRPVSVGHCTAGLHGYAARVALLGICMLAGLCACRSARGVGAEQKGRPGGSVEHRQTYHSNNMLCYVSTMEIPRSQALLILYGGLPSHRSCSSGRLNYTHVDLQLRP